MSTLSSILPDFFMTHGGLKIVPLEHHALGRHVLSSLAKTEKASRKREEILGAIQAAFEHSESERVLHVRQQLGLHSNEIVAQVSDRILRVLSIRGVLPELTRTGFFVFDQRAVDFAAGFYPELLKINKGQRLGEVKTGSSLKRLLDQVDAAAPSCLVGIGGGRTMDMMKFLGWKLRLPMVAIPTSLASHVYASTKIHCLPAIRELGFQLTIDGNAPHVALLDTLLLSQLFDKERRLVLAGFGDVMAFFNAREDWHLACRNEGREPNSFVEEMIENVLDWLFEVPIQAPFESWVDTYVAIQGLLCLITDWAGSAPASGAEHLFAKCLEEQSDCLLHGEAVALGTLIYLFLRDMPTGPVFELMKKFELPCSFKEMGVSESQILEALVNAPKEGARKKRFTICDELSGTEGFYQQAISRMKAGGLLCR